MTDERLNQLETLANAVVLRTGDTEVAVVPMLVAEVRRLQDAVATVSGERDALAAVVEVLRQYYQRKANDDELYAAFCAWRENPFAGKTSA